MPWLAIRTKLTDSTDFGAKMTTPPEISRPTPRLKGLVLGVIGLGGAIASPRSQTDSGKAPALALVDGPASEAFGERLFGDLAPDEAAKWIDGFDAVLRIGPAVVPLLDGFLQIHEGEVTYLQVRVARSLALASSRERIWPELAAGRRRGRGSAETQDRLRARFVAQLAVALGAPIRGEWNELREVALTEREPILQATALAAWARIGGGEIPAESLPSAIFRPRGDVAPLAALAFRAAKDVPTSRLQEWQRVARREPEASLVHRGHFLSSAQLDPRRATDGDLRRLRWALGRPGVDPELVRCVLLHLARSGFADDWVEVLGQPFWSLRSDPRWVRCLGEDPRFRRLLLEAGALRASEIDDRRSQGRIAVLFARAATTEELVSSASEGDEERRRALVLGLALRLAESPSDVDAIAVADAFGQSPEVQLLRLLAPGRPGAEVRRLAENIRRDFDRGPLRSALGHLATSDGPLDRARFAAALRRMLIDAGIEPGLERVEADRLLVRDCVLTGSRYGDKFGVPRGQRVEPPSGIAFEDRSFAIGIALHDVLAR